MTAVIEQYHDRVRNDVFAIVPEHAGRLLDVGGGVGATSAALKAQGRATSVTLVDQVAVEVAAGVDQAFAGDLDDVSLIERVVHEAGPFDTMICLDVLEHLRDPWTTVAQMHAGLVPNGCLVISLPNMNHLGVVKALVLKGRFDLTDSGIMDRTHLRWFTRATAVELATGSGLKLEQVQDNIYDPRYKRVNRLTFGLFARFFATQFVIRVRRVDG
jgi:2-polyprenyl-3-methyl-5-hydroxy-6-metoxy-1,4-benzoquinol methylase